MPSTSSVVFCVVVMVRLLSASGSLSGSHRCRRSARGVAGGVGGGRGVGVRAVLDALKDDRPIAIAGDCRRNRKEAQAFEQGHAGIFGQREHASLKRQQTQFGIDQLGDVHFGSMVRGRTTHHPYVSFLIPRFAS